MFFIIILGVIGAHREQKYYIEIYIILKLEHLEKKQNVNCEIISSL